MLTVGSTGGRWSRYTRTINSKRLWQSVQFRSSSAAGKYLSSLALSAFEYDCCEQGG